MLGRSVLLLVCVLATACLVTSKDSDGSSNTVLYKQTTRSPGTQTHKWVAFKNILYKRVGEPVHRHIVRRIANGVYAIGRFINEAGKKSLRRLNSAFPQVGEPTVMCEKMSCMFCTFASVPSFNFEKDAFKVYSFAVCMEFALHPKDFGISVKLIIDDSVFTEYHVSWRKPADVKLELGGIYSVFFRTRLYNNRVYNSTLYTCASLELDFPFNSMLYLEMGCYYLGPEGAGRWTGEIASSKVNTQNNTQQAKEDNKYRNEKSRSSEESEDVETDNSRRKTEEKTPKVSPAEGISILTTIIPTTGFERKSTNTTTYLETNNNGIMTERSAVLQESNINSTHVKEKIYYGIVENGEINNEPHSPTIRNDDVSEGILEKSQNEIKKEHQNRNNQITMVNKPDGIRETFEEAENTARFETNEKYRENELTAEREGKQNFADDTNRIIRRQVDVGHIDRKDVKEEFVSILNKANDSHNSIEDEESEQSFAQVKGGGENEETDEDEEMKIRLVNLINRMNQIMTDEERDDVLAKYDEILT